MPKSFIHGLGFRGLGFKSLFINLKITQLHLLYCGLGLEEPTDDIAINVGCVHSLIGGPPTLNPIMRSRIAFGFVAKL